MKYIHENLTMYHNIHYKYYTYTLTEPHYWNSAVIPGSVLILEERAPVSAWDVKAPWVAACK